MIGIPHFFWFFAGNYVVFILFFFTASYPVVIFSLSNTPFHKKGVSAKCCHPNTCSGLFFGSRFWGAKKMPPHLEDLEASGKMPVFFCWNVQMVPRFLGLSIFFPLALFYKLRLSEWRLAQRKSGPVDWGGMDDTAGTLPTSDKLGWNNFSYRGVNKKQLPID